MARTTGEATPDHRCTGTRALRVEDVVRPGILHVCFVRSPVARARITAINVSAALQLDRVHAVFGARDINPGVREQRYTRNGRDDPDTLRPPSAEDAAERVVVEYDELPPVTDYANALEFAHSVHASRPGDLVGERTGRLMEDLAPVFEAAPQVVGVTVRQQAYCPVPMGTWGIVAEWSAPAGEMVIWAATQSPHEVRSFRARLLGVDEHRVCLVMRDTGGGFGQKVLSQREDMRVILAAAVLSAALECKPAPFGRGTLAEVAGALIGRFAENLAAELPVPTPAPAAVLTPTPFVAEPVDLMDAADGGALERIAPAAPALAVLLLTLLVQSLLHTDR